MKAFTILSVQPIGEDGPAERLLTGWEEGRYGQLYFTCRTYTYKDVVEGNCKLCKAREWDLWVREIWNEKPVLARNSRVCRLAFCTGLPLDCSLGLQNPVFLPGYRKKNVLKKWNKRKKSVGLQNAEFFFHFCIIVDCRQNVYGPLYRLEYNKYPFIIYRIQKKRNAFSPLCKSVDKHGIRTLKLSLSAAWITTQFAGADLWSPPGCHGGFQLSYQEGWRIHAWCMGLENMGQPVWEVRIWQSSHWQ